MNRVGTVLRWRHSYTQNAPLCDQSVAEPRAFYSHFNRSESPHTDVSSTAHQCFTAMSKSFFVECHKVKEIHKYWIRNKHFSCVHSCPLSLYHHY